MFLSPSEIHRLVGDRAHQLRYLDYDEEAGTRNYCLDLDSFGAREGGWYFIRIGLMTHAGQEAVEVTVHAGHRGNVEFGRFTLCTTTFASPLTLDPQAVRRGMDVVIADRSR